ncbi:FdhF/YdeP family oxidoreductase [Spirosoma endophyticum]|uniref:Oxidoreductase alpha (Molybdopterin) subunit n=1 Tax=Spirosoma endophyticum TaxID=662367 RepID=A0A1I1UB26_9BACT|nr:FdhF/YdeP family oxidoreductase [Spirosoma endophyticum]SFD65130.1 oxidoreductase alpha (molybdopterin) subunit [Spirosoma endophyticum]
MDQNTPPEELTGELEVGKPYTEAAGVTAIVKSLEHIVNGTDLIRGLKVLADLNQKDGFDCPSCAWPDPDGHRSKLGEYCESGAKAVADEIMDKHTASPVLFQRYSVAELLQKGDLWLGQQGRLTQPLILKPGATHYDAISWNDAFQLIADQLKALDSPDEAIFYTSGRTSNEAAFLYQLFVRMFGTNNMPDCSNMCHESTSVALADSLGLGKASVKYEDYEKADVIMIMGQNPGTNAPRMLTPLEEAKRNGAKIIAVNPLHEAGLLAFKYPQSPRDILFGGQKLTDVFLQVRINSDLALMKAMAKILLEEEKKAPGKVLDQNFIQQYTSGYNDYVKSLDQFELNDLAAQCGLTVAQIQEAVDLFKYTPKLIICWAMGLTQHRNSVDSINEIINLLLLKGSIGIEGGGASPIRGHSNVQGDRTMGIWEKPKPEFLDALKRVFKFEPPRENGYDTVAAVKAMKEGKARAFFGLGGNFAMAVSDTNYTADALKNCKLTVHVSTKLNRSHLIHGETALILPCLGRTDKDIQATGEQFVSCESTTGVVAQSHGSVDPISSNLKSEVAIIGELAKAVFSTPTETVGRDNNTSSANLPGRYYINWDALIADYDKIRDLIEKVVPGFDNYNEQVRKPGGFYIPNGPRVREFKTKDGKAHFTINAPTHHELQPGELLLMTVRSHDQFNTTIYGNDDRYRGIYNERRVVFMNSDDMANLGFTEKQVVDLHSEYNGQKRTAHRFLVIPYNIPQGCTAAYFPETNVLVPIDSIADKSHTPTSKSIVITVTPAAE